MDFFNNLQWYDYVRLATVLTSLITMYLLIHTYVFHKEDFTPKILDHWLSKNFFLFASFYSGAEAILYDRPVSSTVFVVCAASCFALSATLRSQSPSDIQNQPPLRRKEKHRKA